MTYARTLEKSSASTLRVCKYTPAETDFDADYFHVIRLHSGAYVDVTPTTADMPNIIQAMAGAIAGQWYWLEPAS